MDWILAWDPTTGLPQARATAFFANGATVPVVSSFFGIAIRMYYREHGPPHFHAEHQGQHASFTLDGKMLAGFLRSRTARRLIRKWALAHRDALEANWARARACEPLMWIAPLD